MAFQPDHYSPVRLTQNTVELLCEQAEGFLVDTWPSVKCLVEDDLRYPAGYEALFDLLVLYGGLLRLSDEAKSLAKHDVDGMIEQLRSIIEEQSNAIVQQLQRCQTERECMCTHKAMRATFEQIEEAEDPMEKARLARELLEAVDALQLVRSLAPQVRRFSDRCAACDKWLRLVSRRAGSALQWASENIDQLSWAEGYVIGQLGAFGDIECAFLAETTRLLGQIQEEIDRIESTAPIDIEKEGNPERCDPVVQAAFEGEYIDNDCNPDNYLCKVDGFFCHPASFICDCQKPPAVKEDRFDDSSRTQRRVADFRSQAAEPEDEE